MDRVTTAQETVRESKESLFCFWKNWPLEGKSGKIEVI